MRSEEFRATAFLRASRCFWTVIVGLSAAAAAEPNLFAQCSYEVSGIISPDDADSCAPLPPSNTFARGMNSKGEVVGYYVPCAIGNERAFFWSQVTGFVTLPKPPDVVQAFAQDINDHGIIIGQHVFSGVGSKGYVYDPKTQVFTYLEPLHAGAVATNLTTVASINNSNIITGSRVISEPGVSPSISNAVLWMPFGDDGDGIILDLGVGDGPRSAAEDGNSGEDAAGWSGSAWHTANAKALLWTDGMTVELGVLPGANSSHADAMNNDLTAVGASRDGIFSFFRGFRWEDGTMIELEPPLPFERFRPHDISDYGQIVGILQPGNVAGLWQNSTFNSIQSLLVDPPVGLTLTTAAVLNEHGQIRGAGNMSGKTVGVLLSPAKTLIGDLDFNCKVNVGDLLVLLSEWQQPNSKADLNGDGTVGVADLLILLSNWSP